ncbi:hypothetical protein MSG28_014446 [Choristoneura fumiferana]|uniref:Uncharacterized protein n=1 Tax=Choristoneura fumiferana TaxID=7141 RepID=A0ACC0JRG1_CHOFU|nr:hypothetical protein MSG28_014446 [Choristoneura fumiferana]
MTAIKEKADSLNRATKSETAAMKPTRKYYLFLLLALAFYFTTSKLIFDKVHDTTQIVIDELFHIPQGIAYCQHVGAGDCTRHAVVDKRRRASGHGGYIAIPF